MHVFFFLGFFALCLPNMLLHGADQGLLAAFQILNISREQGIYDRYMAQLNRDTESAEVKQQTDQKRSETPFSSASSSPMASPQTVRWPSLQPPRVTVEWSGSLEFGDNAFAMYDFDGRDNKLTCCYMDEKIWGPLYVEYPDDEKKSYGVQELIDKAGVAPTYRFDDSNSWTKIPNSDLCVYRFSIDVGTKEVYQALKCEREKIVWRSPLIPLAAKKLVMHRALPYFATGEKNSVKVYSTKLFTESSDELLKSPLEITVEAEAPELLWHPNEYKFLTKFTRPKDKGGDVFCEYNGDTKQFDKLFFVSKDKELWLRPGAYISETQQIIAFSPYRGLYELRENDYPKKLDTSVEGKKIRCNKIIGVVKKYLIIECMFLDNPRFLGIYDALANKMYKAHDFKTEQGSIVYDPNTLKMFHIGHRVYYSYPSRCQEYNRECQILKVELGE